MSQTWKQIDGSTSTLPGGHYICDCETYARQISRFHNIHRTYFAGLIVWRWMKEIGDIAGIPKSKPLVTHLARKTFATTVALTNGMNIGVLSKILGHNSIKVTLDSYGTIIDELMLRNVAELKERLSSKKDVPVISHLHIDSSAQEDLIRELKKSLKN